jgi:hypothetical protein
MSFVSLATALHAQGQGVYSYLQSLYKRWDFFFTPKLFSNLIICRYGYFKASLSTLWMAIIVIKRLRLLDQQ